MIDLPENLPWDTRITYARLLTEQRPARRDQLTFRVVGYLGHIQSTSKANDSLDTAAAQSLGNSLLKLIERCPEQHEAHLQAAVAYFVHSDDAEHDFDSVAGFADDLGVFNAVCDHVGLPDLKVSH
jgi:uncharacterized membrane protein YkvA (DUF1232 family)